ncbi:RNA-directed DNA polymerase from mobile element jockey [Folsomia candida]|uniref:RNA-directed DNA polymerase from mobile element jockey n=1 Tax=Folsomia candida TaxID=158441 RepID=A0A226D9T5_FOLCA|nr:RNA-directed DNA polymerase from mobile element jockey [Folsomia candida]
MAPSKDLKSPTKNGNTVKTRIAEFNFSHINSANSETNKRPRTRSMVSLNDSTNDDPSPDPQNCDTIMQFLTNHELRISSKIDTLTENLKCSVSDIKVCLLAHQTELNTLKNDVAKLTKGNIGLSTRMDYLECHNKQIERDVKRINLIISGLSDPLNESLEELRIIVNKLLSNIVKQEINVDSVLRLGSHKAQGCRRVIVRFSCLSDRESVWNSRKETKPPIFINEDLPYTLRRDFAILRKKAKEFKDNNENCTINWKNKSITSDRESHQVCNGRLVANKRTESEECIISTKKPVPIKKQKHIRNYSNINLTDLATYINNIEASQGDVETVTHGVINDILAIYDILAPIRTVTYYVHQHKKFVSCKTRQIIKQRDKAYKACRRDPSPANIQSFKNYKSLVKRNILEDTKHEFNKKVEKLHFWGALEKIYPLLSPAAEINLEPDTVNSFFVNISTRDHAQTLPPLPTKPALLWDDLDLSFKFWELSTQDILKAWKGTKNKGSTSLETTGLCNKMMNMCMTSPKFRIIIMNLFNMYINEESVPNMLKLAKVIPIPKVKNPVSPNELRPIAIQPVLTKLFEFQFGFRKFHSTTHALIAVTDFVYKAWENDQVCIMVALDVAKAYDKACKEVLLHKLKWYGVDSKLQASY